MTTDARTIVITGASDGIGAAAARRLHAAGHHVVVVGRDPVKTARIAGELGTSHHVGDFTRLDDVSRLATELLAAYPRIDVLANNAGALFDSARTTGDGFERTLQVNYLAPYLLTRLLLGNVTAAHGAVLWTSSAVVRTVRTVDLDTLDPDALNPDTPAGSAVPVTAERHHPVRVYAHAKLAALLTMSELHHRFGTRGLRTAAFHPGFVGTNFSADSTGIIGWFYRSSLKTVMTATPDRGADQLVHLATRDDWTSGLAYERGHPARRPHPALTDRALSREVWARTEEVLAAHVE